MAGKIFACKWNLQLFGGITCLLNGMYSYLADVTSLRSRTTRIALLDIFFFAGIVCIHLQVLWILWDLPQFLGHSNPLHSLHCCEDQGHPRAQALTTAIQTQKWKMAQHPLLGNHIKIFFLIHLFLLQEKSVYC